MMLVFKRICKYGWNNFVRQGGLTFATLFVIFIAVVLSTLLFIFQGGVEYLSAQLQEKIDISVTFKEDASKEDIEKLEEELLNIEEVKKVEYISPEEAYENFVSNHQDDDYLAALEAIQVNPFLSSLHIQTFSANQYQSVSEFIQNSDYNDMIYEVDDYKRGVVVETLCNITNNINTIGLGFTIFLGLIAVLISFNTLRLSIFSQKEEIEIMKLVGARKIFVQGPFIIQGILCGIIAAALSFFLFYALLLILETNLETLLMGFNVFGYYKANIFSIFLIQFAMAIGLGLLGSFFAIRKYLKV